MEIEEDRIKTRRPNSIHSSKFKRSKRSWPTEDDDCNCIDGTRHFDKRNRPPTTLIRPHDDRLGEVQKRTLENWQETKTNDHGLLLTNHDFDKIKENGCLCGTNGFCNSDHLSASHCDAPVEILKNYTYLEQSDGEKDLFSDELMASSTTELPFVQNVIGNNNAFDLELGVNNASKTFAIDSKKLLESNSLERSNLLNDPTCQNMIGVNAAFLQSDNMTPNPATRRNKLSWHRSIGGSNSRVSLKERMKQQLLENSTKIPFVNHNIEDKIRKSAIEQARFDASQIRKEGTSSDIGPFYGLPAQIQNSYKKTRGIDKLYDWQDECLKLPAVADRKNLIYTLPTGGGKTLVAEILIMRELLCHQRDALLILPFVSIVQEKVRTMSELATELDFLVEEYAGAKGRFPPIKQTKNNALYIATIEKGHSLINSLIETKRLGSVGLVVVDELHMLGEGGSRGAALESTLLKIQAANEAIQIIGMSATLNNLKDLQQFLDAELYCNNFRPVSLQEFVKIEDNIFSVDNTVLHEDKLQHDRVVTFPYSKEVLREDPDHILGLVTEVIPNNSCLVFCATKKNCENVALMLCRLMSKHQRHLLEVRKEERRALLQELRQDGSGQICQVLEYTVHFGIAYHHSGLTTDERRLIEDAYSAGTLILLTCTSTLAAGVNLPAKRVILRSPYIGANFLKYSQYKQMSGRAGRAGLDSSGDSVLIVKKSDRLRVKALLAGPKDFCHSSMMYDGGKGIRTFLLSAVGLKLVTDTSSAFALMQKSLLKIQCSVLFVDVEAVTREAIQYLVDANLIVQVMSNNDGESAEQNSCSLKVSTLGKATFKGSVDHTYSSQLYEDLRQTAGSFNLATHLHLLYLVTPYDAAHSVTPDWNIYYNQYCKLTERDMETATVNGIPESYLGLKAAGRHSKKVSELPVKRFYLTLMLWDLWNQRSVWQVAQRFSQSRGFLQNLWSQAAAFGSCVTHFCQELEEFWGYQDLLPNFVKRMRYCVSSELLPLMEIPGVKLARAKQLFSAGFTTVTQIASTESTVLVSTIGHMSNRQATQIICAAKNILGEQTAALMEEVESLVVVPHKQS